MKTRQLITLLAGTSHPTHPHEVGRRFALAVAGGVISAIFLLIVILGIRPDLDQALMTWAFWSKLAFSASTAGGALVVASRLAQPGVEVQKAWLAIAIPCLLLALITALALMRSPDGTTWSLISDHLWRSCPLDIAGLSLPGLGALLHAMRRLAPTHLAYAGAMAGLIAGASAAFVYCLHCPESQMVFWAARYVLGMAIPTILGAVLGPRLLRW